MEKGKPVERRGRKASGLQETILRQRGCCMTYMQSSWTQAVERVRALRLSIRALMRVAALMPLALGLAGCLDDGSGDAQAAGAVTPNTLPPVSTPEVAGPPATNQAPEISGTPLLTVQAGQLYSFTPEASDGDEDFLEFTITNAPAWATFSDETGTLTGTPEDEHVGESEDITITVTDGRDTRSIGPFLIRVNSRNRAPAPSNAAPTLSGTPAASVMIDQPYSFAPTAADADGDRLTFAVSNRPSWVTFNTRTGALTGTPALSNIGSYSNIVVTVSDGEAMASIGPFSIQVRGPNNSAPTISGSPGAAVQVGQTYTFTPTGRDADNDPLTYSIANRPVWATFSTSNGRLTGTPTSAHVGSYPNIVITVSDGRASANLRAFAINVQAPQNGAPTISGSPTTSVNAGTAYSFQPTASDPDNDALGFSIQNRPSWASFDTKTGRLSGTPTQAATHSNVTISVSDGRATTALAAFTIRVNTAPSTTNRPPTISGTPSNSVRIGSSYSFQPTASDPDGNSLTFSIQNRPSWASFSTSTGRLSGTPSASNAGAYAGIVISVTDGSSSVSLPAFSINVIQAANGSATLSWQPPTQNEDGTPLTNLAGYRVTYGQSASALSEQVELTNPGLSSYMVSGLGSGTWYFAVKSFTAAGVESDLSNLASKTIP